MQAAPKPRQETAPELRQETAPEQRQNLLALRLPMC